MENPVVPAVAVPAAAAGPGAVGGTRWIDDSHSLNDSLSVLVQEMFPR